MMTMGNVGSGANGNNNNGGSGGCTSARNQDFQEVDGDGKSTTTTAAAATGILSFPCDFDHMYASMTDGAAPAAATATALGVSPLRGNEPRHNDLTEVKHLKELLLLHLDLIQQQSEQIVTKDKLLAALRQENETVRAVDDALVSFFFSFSFRTKSLSFRDGIKEKKWILRIVSSDLDKFERESPGLLRERNRKRSFLVCDILFAKIRVFFGDLIDVRRTERKMFESLTSKFLYSQNRTDLAADPFECTPPHNIVSIVTLWLS